jgi:hypothetical protein
MLLQREGLAGHGDYSKSRSALELLEFASSNHYKYFADKIPTLHQLQSADRSLLQLAVAGATGLKRLTARHRGLSMIVHGELLTSIFKHVRLGSVTEMDLRGNILGVECCRMLAGSSSNIVSACSAVASDRHLDHHWP